jgi:hypothetical protein
MCMILAYAVYIDLQTWSQRNLDIPVLIEEYFPRVWGTSGKRLQYTNELFSCSLDLLPLVINVHKSPPIVIRSQEAYARSQQKLTYGTKNHQYLISTWMVRHLKVYESLR